ncbi:MULTISPECIES: MarR family winged helix-turn-helix transcriptional regulator [Aneurinibacillus]|uniref:DNA-binding transcriptional regulator, MarR family n=1 Tax=Aneurinibacillus thermoaerophilus TaxID=143495 RepID=A0A1G7YAC2_ANETH|nr:MULTISPECIES: MarR family transcriptional regulator [Aneurinibacillus]AMA72151.1 MarR family transcriptional regulator [Aneurinibacillus sp. XH2]MED0676436.1 MarR family transcriptional regulator [Aneurinibacillus thermoaerophilus]MED0678948.1 MarR family transcriptional regulator [Aneurinibacillus thermoaerophilus]MED0736485.1 MarR family transcriptional regulator [Aneurinibacillus thermoaerophilus]MED0755988.1 MarR family transcriptional regulator [Aneurinibacillus thermoaerophilus]
MNVYGHRINQAARHFVKKLNEHLAPLDLYNAQWAVILRLRENGTSTQVELCNELCVEPPTMTRTLARMEQGGWITREEGTDRRERKVKLSQKAYEMLPVLEKASEMVETQALKGIKEEDLRIFTCVLEQMVKNLNEK